MCLSFLQKGFRGGGCDGDDNFAKMKVMETIDKEGVKIIPEILISGNDTGGNGAISGILGLHLLEIMSNGKHKEKVK